MKQQLMINIAKRLVLAGFIFLAACSATPEKETSPQRQSSQDQIYDKAKRAYLSGNYKAASALFSNLADRGHADAQYSLGHMYYYGTGTENDLNKAMHWFNLSAAQGNSNAATALATIQKMLTESKRYENPSTATPQQAPANNQAAMIDLRNKQRANAPTVPPQAAITQPAPRVAQPQPVIPQSAPAPRVTQEKPVITQPVPDSTQTKPGVTQAMPGISQANTDTASNPNANNQATQTATVTNPPIIRSDRERKNAQWILKQPSSHYTIQLTTSTSYKKTLSFIRDVELDGVYFYRTSVNGVDRYTIIHGSFPQYATAKTKLSLLKKRGYKNVWIRGMRGIKPTIVK